jgi:capsular polysaccharide transport system permease protein
MLRALDEKFGLRAHYGAPALDFVFRLSPRATQEDMLRYYRRRVEVVLDGQSGLMTLRTQGFTAEFAEQLNREIITASERFINESSHRLAREQMEFAEQQLAIAREAVDEARSQVFKFQTRYGVLDPTAQALANTGLTAELRAALSRQEAELKVALGYLNEDSHQVQALRTQIAGLREQLDAESRRAITNPRGKSLNVLAGEYQELLARLQFAQDAYKIALTGLETARIESTRKIKSLVLVESPARPESAEQPRRGYTLVVLLLGLTIVYGIIRLVVATIEDHRE